MWSSGRCDIVIVIGKRGQSCSLWLDPRQPNPVVDTAGSPDREVSMQRIATTARRWNLPNLMVVLLLVGITSTVPPVTAGDVDTGSAEAQRSIPATGTYRHAVVAADHPLASQAGIEILKSGGNVVDAAVSTMFALSVVRPASSGLGGGGFMVIWNAKQKQAIAIDYRERAPGRTSRKMFADPNRPGRAIPELSRRGHLAIAVPGTVAGLCFAAEHYGRIGLKRVLAPAIRLAREGIRVDAHGREIQRTVLRSLRQHRGDRQRFAALWKQYLNNGKEWTAADRFRSPQRRLLEIIAAQGARGFYRGPVAEAIVAESRRGGGLISRKDLASMKPVVRKPLRGRFDGFDLVAMPTPSSGGIALLEALNILTAYETLHPGQRLQQLDRPASIHLLTEVLKHAFADRAAFLGDADFVKVPVARLTSPAYANRLAGRIDPARTKPLTAYGRSLPVSDSGTSHVSIIDAGGNAVACTETINTLFGSYVVEPTYGIVLNNEMDDFAAMPGQPNFFGLVQSSANAVAPGKKPLSSMSPTIILKEGKAVWSLGGSGGPRIISGTLQVLLGMIRLGKSPAQAVRQPRFHHQWLPDILFVEKPLFGRVRAPLETRKHTVRLLTRYSVIQAVSRKADGLRGGSDPRKGGRPAGY